MQDFQAFPDLAGHFLAASSQPAAGGDVGSAELRRFRGYSGLPPTPPPAAQQLPVKCPRCDSTNTKFCYYNNYNLAQPRHFCRACRRYWTKGGVLRNVPVGGGCRKSKRSSSSFSSSSITSKASSKNSPSRAIADKGGNGQLHRHPPSASWSSSDGSSGVPTTAAKPAAVATSAAAFAEPIIFTQNANTNCHSNQSTIYDALATADEAPFYFQGASVVGLTSMMTTPTVTSTAPPPELLGFGFLDGSSVRYPGTQQTLAAGEARVQLQHPQPHISHGFPPPPPPQLVNVDPPGIGCSAGCLEAVDWQGAVVDPAFFDLAVGGVGAADPGMYWSQSQWADTDPSLYLP